VLTASLNRRWMVLVGFLVVAASCGVLLKALKSELAPIEDRGIIFGMFIAPEGATLNYTEKYAREIEGIYSQTKDVERYFVVAGNPTVSQGISVLGLNDWALRKRNSLAIAKELFPRFGQIPGVMAFPDHPAIAGAECPGATGQLRDRDLRQLRRVAEGNRAVSRRTGEKYGLQNIDTDLKLNKPELSVDVDRNKAADMGVPVETIGRTLETFLGGRQVTRFKRDGEQYDVIVQVADVERRNRTIFTISTFVGAMAA
jgi:multidrug efflux pump